MPPAAIVAIFLAGASYALLRSPMPPWVRRLNSTAFAYLAVVYVAEAMNVMTLEQKQAIIRWGLLVVSAIIVFSISAWKWGGDKAWRK